jgi:hypothetical protein
MASSETIGAWYGRMALLPDVIGVRLDILAHCSNERGEQFQRLYDVHPGNFRLYLDFYIRDDEEVGPRLLAWRPAHTQSQRMRPSVACQWMGRAVADLRNGAPIEPEVGAMLRAATDLGSCG